MALQLPAEFPLGLVFVVGEIKVDSRAAQGVGQREFYLLEGDHHLRCRLSDRTAEETSLNPGDLIRAGGHIVFDPAMASYCLLARDVELLSEYEPISSPVAELIAISDQETDTDLSPVILPQWVQELAPPEVQKEWAARRLAEVGATLVVSAETTSKNEIAVEPATVTVGNWRDLVAGDVDLTYRTDEPALAELSDDLIEFLSEAIDSNDVIELTPAVLAEYAHPDELVENPDELALPAEPVASAEPVEAQVEEPSQEGYAPDPENAFAAQDASIEEFLSALETAILADEARSQQPDPDLEAMNGQNTAELQEVSAAEAVESDQTLEMAPAEISEPTPPPQKQPSPNSIPRKSKQQPNLIPWFVAVLAIIAVVLFMAILIVMAIGAGLLPLAAS